jgi:hypothetical protein
MAFRISVTQSEKPMTSITPAPNLQNDQERIQIEIQQRTAASFDSVLNRPCASINYGRPAKYEVLEIFGAHPSIYEGRLKSALDDAISKMKETGAKRFRLILRKDPGGFPNSDIFGDSVLLCVVWD